MGITSARIERAVRQVVSGGTRTSDIAFSGTAVGTEEMTEKILAALS